MLPSERSNSPAIKGTIAAKATQEMTAWTTSRLVRFWVVRKRSVAKLNPMIRITRRRSVAYFSKTVAMNDFRGEALRPGLAVPRVRRMASLDLLMRNTID